MAKPIDGFRAWTSGAVFVSVFIVLSFAAVVSVTESFHRGDFRKRGGTFTVLP
jgi:hypothetical protein